jgi:hypothetical protein
MPGPDRVTEPEAQGQRRMRTRRQCVLAENPEVGQSRPEPAESIGMQVFSPWDDGGVEEFDGSSTPGTRLTRGTFDPVPGLCDATCSEREFRKGLSERRWSL